MSTCNCKCLQLSIVEANHQQLCGMQNCLQSTQLHYKIQHKVCRITYTNCALSTLDCIDVYRHSNWYILEVHEGSRNLELTRVESTTNTKLFTQQSVKYRNFHAFMNLVRLHIQTVEVY